MYATDQPGIESLPIVLTVLISVILPTVTVDQEINYTTLIIIGFTDRKILSYAD